MVQAIFDATNTTRERRATVYERIVHQHGLKCMFLESICNRWVLVVHTFNVDITSLCFQERKMEVSQMTSGQKCEQSWESVKVNQRWLRSLQNCTFQKLAITAYSNQFREMGTWFIWHFYGRTTLNMLWWTITPQNGKEGTALSVWTINMDQPEKKTTFA